jgi:hypothetical protein
MEHGMEGHRGFGPEQKVLVRKNGATGKTEWEVQYHMTEPRRVPVTQRQDTVDKIVEMAETVQWEFA